MKKIRIYVSTPNGASYFSEQIETTQIELAAFKASLETLVNFRMDTENGFVFFPETVFKQSVVKIVEG